MNKNFSLYISIILFFAFLYGISAIEDQRHSILKDFIVIFKN